jgi:ABC-2 type transport system permease protein
VVRIEDLDSELDSAGAADLVHSGKLSGVLVVPPNYNQLILKGKPVALSLVTDEYSTNGQSVIQAVRGALTRLMSSVEIARLVVDDLGITSDQEHTAIFQDAVASWKKFGRTSPIFTVEKAQGAPSVGSVLAENPFKQSSPGILVQFAIFGLVTSASMLVEERKTGTLQRLMTTSMSRAEIIAGHMLAMFCVAMMQSTLLVMFGQFFLSIDYLRQPAAILLMMVTLCLWVSSLGLFIGVAAKDESQVTLFSLIAMFAFSALGGAWFPMEIVGSGFSIVGRLTPSFYAMQGFQNVLVRGQGLAEVLFPAAVLGLFALLFFCAAVWRFNSSQQR